MLRGGKSLRELQRLQNRAAGIILRKNTSNDTFCELNWLNLASRRKMHKFFLVLKCLNNLVPKYLTQYFTRNADLKYGLYYTWVQCYDRWDLYYTWVQLLHLCLLPLWQVISIYILRSLLSTIHAPGSIQSIHLSGFCPLPLTTGFVIAFIFYAVETLLRLPPLFPMR